MVAPRFPPETFGVVLYVRCSRSEAVGALVAVKHFWRSPGWEEGRIMVQTRAAQVRIAIVVNKPCCFSAAVEVRTRERCNCE